MEKSNVMKKMQIFATAVITTFIGFLATAQEKAAKLDVNVDVNKATDLSSGNWMQNPLVWVIGALVLILLVAIITRGNNSK